MTLRPDHLRNANLPGEQRGVSRWFDASAFGPPQPGAFGTAAKGTIIGPGSWTVDAGLYKTVPIRQERATLRLEITSTSAFNHPNWNNPSTTITDLGTVAVITGASGVRNVRLGARVEW